MAHEPTRTPPSADEKGNHTNTQSTQPCDNGTVVQSPADVARMLTSSAPVFTVPGYDILGEIGRGAMGVVYKARQVALNRLVALKVILGERLAPDELTRFRTEAEVIASIRHENVVQVYDCGECHGRPFMVLEYLPGGTLADVLSRSAPSAHDPSEFRARAEFVRTIALGVAAAHALGIVHRDLKPTNVLFDERRVPKVSDFGLAKRDGGAERTLDGAILGTPAYMSPEQAAGEVKLIGPRADVWSLGVILYESITGARPFAAENTRALLAQVLTAEPPSPRARATAVPRDLELICLKCLAKQPEDRYPSASELVEDLERFISGNPIGARPRGALERGAHWIAHHVGRTAVLLSLLVVLVVLAVRGFLPAPKTINERPESTPVPGGGAPPAYSLGAAEELFDGQNMLGWNGPFLSRAIDDDKQPVLTIESTVTRRLKTGPNVRVILAFDRYRATSAEVVVATAGAVKWLVRVDAKSVAFGKQAPGAAFEPASAPMPYPAPKEKQPPYLELRYERAGSKLAAWFDGHALGEATADGLKTTELRISAAGGPVRIESAQAVELVETK
jgi:hypothetical protein